MLVWFQLRDNPRDGKYQCNELLFLEDREEELWLGAGTHSITAAYQGTENFIASASTPIVQTVNRNSVSITLTSAPNPSTFGQDSTFTVQVAAQPAGGPVAGVPSGTVSLNDGTVNLGTVKLDNNGAAILTATSLTAGMHVITASYAGDANFTGGSSNPYSQVVNKAVTGTLLASSVNPATVASAVTLSATVTAGATTPSGTVAFFDGAQQIGSGQLDSSGKSVLPISNLSLGSHSFTTAFSGSSNFAASLSSALSETVVDSHSRVALTSSANPQIAGQPVTFVATITAALGGPLNSGLVIFSDGPQQLGATPVINSIASFTTTTLAAGNHQITPNYQAASVPGPFDGTSVVLTEVINRPIVGNTDFTMSIQQAVVQIRAGQSFTTKLILTPINGLTGLETSICQGAPRGAVCRITPERATFNGKTPIIANVTISTSGTEYRNGYPTNGPSRPKRPLRTTLALSSLFAFGSVFLTGFKKQRVSLMAVAVLAGALTGCGGSGHTLEPQRGTPPGRYDAGHLLGIRSRC
jgi:Bacterial Ig-like domain (group 3)